MGAAFVRMFGRPHGGVPTGLSHTLRLMNTYRILKPICIRQLSVSEDDYLSAYLYAMRHALL